MNDIFDLSGRVALVTGGAGHIGAAIAEALAQRGAKIMFLDKLGGPNLVLNPDLYFPSRERRCDAIALDLADAKRIKGVSMKTEKRFGRLDILVNCAGMTAYPAGFDVPFSEQTADAWDACLAVNLRAPFLLSQACAPLLKASGHGSIINIASIYGVVGPNPRLYDGTDVAPPPAAYAASKAGLLGLTRYLATVLAPDIRVNAISPGGVARGQDAAFVQRYTDRAPLGRMATEQDIVGAAVFLASDAAAYVTGQNIAVDGGWTAW